MAESKVLNVHNKNGLPVIEYTELQSFQGDLKIPMAEENLERLKQSLLHHGFFFPKPVWFDDDGIPRILDGHQTKAAIASLEEDGWEIPQIPYIVVEAADARDAAAKLLQFNAMYADVNNETSFFSDVGLSEDELETVLDSVVVPGLDVDAVMTAFSQSLEEDGNETEDTEEEPTEEGASLWEDFEKEETTGELRVVLVVRGKAELDWVEERLGCKVVGTVVEVCDIASV